MDAVSYVDRSSHPPLPFEEERDESSRNDAVVAGDPSLQQLAHELGVCVKTVRRRIADGTIKAYRVGPRLIRVERDSLVRLTHEIPTMSR